MSNELQQALNEPFPAEAVTKKDAGHGNMVDFVPWNLYAKRLNSLVDERAWEVRVEHIEVAAQKLLLVVSVTIEGVRRDGTGSAKASKDSWGGAHSEAFSQAFRRACAAHGLGLYFYEGGASAVEQEKAPDAPSKKQISRMAGLANTGAFTDNELAGWRQRLRSKNTTGVAGAIIREMKEVFEEREGRPFDPSADVA